MKKFRIVTDFFSGYEAQVKYTLFPFAWFQLNDYMGINTWDTAEQAMDFINQKKAGSYVRVKAHEADFVGDCQKEVKRLLALPRLLNNNRVVWQESYNHQTQLQSRNVHGFQPAY